MILAYAYAASNVTKTLKQLYERNEKENRDKYEERVIESEKGSFSPMVFLTTGGTGPEATVVLKRFKTEMVSNKRAEKYSRDLLHKTKNQIFHS